MRDSREKRVPRSDLDFDGSYRIDVSNMDTGVLWRITVMAFRARVRAVIAIAAAISAGIFQIFVPQYLGQAVDDVVVMLERASMATAQTSAVSALLGTAGLLVGVSVMRGLFTMLQNYQGEAIGQILGRELRMIYYSKLQHLSLSWHDRVHTGDLMARGILDIEGVRLWIDTGILRSIYLAVLICGGAVTLVGIDPLLGILSLSFVPIVATIASISRLRLRETWLKLQEELAHLTRIMEENLAGIRVVRAFAAQAHELVHYDSVAGRALGTSHRRVDLFVASTTAMTFVFFCAMGAVLFIGGSKVLDGEVSVGELAECLAFMTILQMPVRQIGWMINSIARASTCGGRLFNILDLEPSISNSPDARPLAVTDGVVRFEDVNFSYPASVRDSRTLTGISFEVRKGRTVGIVGPPGSGKSTIAHLVARFYDVTGGRITIDGQDVRDVTLESLRAEVVIAPQEPFVFTADLDHNIAYGDPWAGRSSIERSSMTAQLHNFIRNLPEGYGTLVGERGVSLSGGQRQRLVIARGVLVASSVLVLDDSTSAIDAATEQRIRHELSEYVRARAVIIIAHRLNSLKHADEILFLDNGRIIERGSHAELMSLNGSYRALHDLQAGSAE